MIPKLVLALFTASLLAEVLPAAAILSVVGPDTGLMGIVLASILGGILPGGPVTAFPIALFVWQIGAGVPQVVALLTGWACFAFHRLLAYEIPMIGPRYAVLRMLSVAVVPVNGGPPREPGPRFPPAGIGGVREPLTGRNGGRSASGSRERDKPAPPSPDLTGRRLHSTGSAFCHAKRCSIQLEQHRDPSPSVALRGRDTRNAGSRSVASRSGQRRAGCPATGRSATSPVKQSRVIPADAFSGGVPRRPPAPSTRRRSAGHPAAPVS